MSHINESCLIRMSYIRAITSRCHVTRMHASCHTTNESYLQRRCLSPPTHRCLSPPTHQCPSPPVHQCLSLPVHRCLSPPIQMLSLTPNTALTPNTPHSTPHQYGLKQNKGTFFNRPIFGLLKKSPVLNGPFPRYIDSAESIGAQYTARS